MACCRSCGRIFQNVMQLGAHRRRCVRDDNTAESVQNSDGDENENAESDLGLITEPVQNNARFTVHSLARRETAPWGRVVAVSYEDRPQKSDDINIRDYRQVQQLWRNYVSNARACCSSQFWKVFGAVIGQNVNCRDKVIHTVRDIVPSDTSNGKWTRSTRTLLARINRHAGTFWDNITITKRIDLSRFQLPGCKSVDFAFVDPIYVWITCCNNLNNLDIPLLWEPKSLLHPDTGEQVYGGGIQYSLLLRHATSTIPVSGRAALFNLSWDGGQAGFGGRSAVPVCVQTMNTNSMNTAAVGLVGYLPYIEVDAGYKDNENCVAARRHLLQVFTHVRIDSSWVYMDVHIIHMYKPPMQT